MSCRSPRRRIQALLLVLGLVAATAPAADKKVDPAARPAAALSRTDFVLLLDVSGSMNKRRGLARARRLLVGVLDKIVHPGAQVALIPFGTGVHEARAFEIPADREGAAGQRDVIAGLIKQVRAGDSYTYLFEAIEKSLETLRGFKKNHPDHQRRVILISDGKQLVRRGESFKSLRQIIAHFEKLGFHKGEDWFIWYGHFGEADDTLRRLLEETGAGKIISLDDLPTLQWADTSLHPALLRLGVLKPGAFSRTLHLTASTDEAGVGQTLLLGLDPGKLPAGMRLAIEPDSVKLTGLRTDFELTLHCEGARPGAYEDAAITVAAAEGTLHWVETERVALLFRVALPRIDVGSSEVLFGRLAPGSRAVRRFVLIPNRDAIDSGPGIKLRIEGAPEGVGIKTTPRDLKIDRRREVLVEVSVPEGAVPGAYACKLVLDGGGTVEVVPSKVTLRYRVGRGRVTVGADRIELGELVAGNKTSGRVTLTPDDESAAAGVAVKVALEGAPEGVTLKVPGSVVLHGRAALRVELSAEASAAPGSYRTKLRFSAPEGVDVAPAELPVVFVLTPAARLVLPEVVDLGDRPASKAREVQGSFRIAAGAHHAGGELELVAGKQGTVLDPRVVSLHEGANRIAFTLRGVDPTPGSKTRDFKVTFVKGDRRTEAGRITFRWRVTPSTLVVHGLSGPAAVGPGSGAAQAELTLEASPDLAGRKLRLIPVLGTLAAGMSVGLPQQEYVVKGGVQTLPLALKVEGAKPGRYQGELRVVLESPVQGVDAPQPIGFVLAVQGAVVHAALEGGLEGLRAGEPRDLTLVLTGSGLQQPVGVALELDRAALPSGVAAKLPGSVQVPEDGTAVRVPLRFAPEAAVAAGNWEPRLRLRSSSGEVAIDPPVLTVHASLTEAVVVERASLTPWIVAGACLLLFLVVAAILIRRRKPRVVEVSLNPDPEAGCDEDDELILDEDELFVIED